MCTYPINSGYNIIHIYIWYIITYTCCIAFLKSTYCDVHDIRCWLLLSSTVFFVVSLSLWSALSSPVFPRVDQAAECEEHVGCLWMRKANGGHRSRKMIYTWLVNSTSNLVGGIPTPLKNMSSSVGMMTFPTVSGKSNQIPWFQSPPSSFILWTFTGGYGYIFMLGPLLISQWHKYDTPTGDRILTRGLDQQELHMLILQINPQTNVKKNKTTMQTSTKWFQLR